MKNVYMLREGNHVMTVYHKGIPHVIAFSKPKLAKKTLFEIDTRASQSSVLQDNSYFHINSTNYNTRLDITKKQDVQFGKLHIDDVPYNTFLEYLNHPKAPFLLLLNEEIEDNKKHLLFEGRLVFEKIEK